MSLIFNVKTSYLYVYVTFIFCYPYKSVDFGVWKFLHFLILKWEKNNILTDISNDINLIVHFDYIL